MRAQAGIPWDPAELSTPDLFQNRKLAALTTWSPGQCHAAEPESESHVRPAAAAARPGRGGRSAAAEPEGQQPATAPSPSTGGSAEPDSECPTLGPGGDSIPGLSEAASEQAARMTPSQ